MCASAFELPRKILPKALRTQALIALNNLHFLHNLHIVPILHILHILQILHILHFFAFSAYFAYSAYCAQSTYFSCSAYFAYSAYISYFRIIQLSTSLWVNESVNEPVSELLTYEAVSDQGPVWVQKEPNFQGSRKVFLMNKYAAFIISVRSSNSHPDLLVITTTTPLFQI